VAREERAERAEQEADADRDERQDLREPLAGGAKKS
jgi:hypothetical protein